MANDDLGCLVTWDVKCKSLNSGNLFLVSAKVSRKILEYLELA